MKIDDNLLEALGNAYRAACGRNDVIIKDGWAVFFEDFLRWYIDQCNDGFVNNFEAFVRWYLVPQGRQQVSA